MRIESCFLLGTIHAKYSFKGELLLKLKTNEPSHCIDILDICFILSDDNLVPYFVLSKSIHKSFIRIQFEGIDNESLTENLLNKEVYIPLEKLSQIKNDSTYHYDKYVGYNLFEGAKYLGKVKEILEFKQPLMCLETESQNEIFIPFVKDFIEKIDEKNSTIYMNLPTGLLEMNQ